MTKEVLDGRDGITQDINITFIAFQSLVLFQGRPRGLLGLGRGSPFPFPIGTTVIYLGRIKGGRMSDATERVTRALSSYT